MTSNTGRDLRQPIPTRQIAGCIWVAGDDSDLQVFGVSFWQDEATDRHFRKSYARYKGVGWSDPNMRDQPVWAPDDAVPGEIVFPARGEASAVAFSHGRAFGPFRDFAAAAFWLGRTGRWDDSLLIVEFKSTRAASAAGVGSAS
jgi:hypothetical protein